MDKIYMDSNVENDNTEHIRGKRLSSILKAPRNPLDDLGNGNELTQDLNIEKRRKSSRRVSFANTINCRVFHRDLKNNAAERENEEDTENHVLLNQNEEPEAVPCEITGMNTLLHAPIQSLVQQTDECHDVDNTIPRTDRPDATVIFSDENEMDMTASHTAVIARNLNNSETDKTEKIDIASFLAELNSINGKAEKNKDFHFSFDAADRFCPSFEQKEDATTGKKINSNEFFMNSNEKALNPIEGPEKENLFFVPSQVSENMARSSVEYVYSHEQLATCNVTKIFREQDDGMEITKCQASDIQNMHSGLSEVPTEQLASADVTQAFADDRMDMTTNHTAKIHFPFAIVGNQSLNSRKDFSSMELDNYCIVKRTSHQQLILKQDPQLCTRKKIINVEDTVDATALQAFKQESRTLSSIPGSVSSETVFRDDKTVVFSQCDDMEITGNYRDVLYNTSTRGMNSSCNKAFEKTVNRSSLLVERRHPVNNDNTRSLSLDDRSSPSRKNSARELSSGSDGQNERVTQDHSTVSLNTGFNSCTNSMSTGSSKGRLQHRLANSLLVSLPGEKTAIFSGTDVDLTKNCVGKGYRKNIENEFPPGLSNSVTCKPHFLDSRSVSSNLREQEKMEITKCQTVVSGDQSIGITTEAEQRHCKIIPSKNQNNNVSDSLDRDKENLEAIGFDVSIRRSQAIEANAKGVEVVTVNKKPGKTDFQASSLSSCAKSRYSLQEQKREVSENIVTDKCAFTSLQSEKVYVSQPLGNKLPNSSVSCTNDKRDMFSDDENMDITKAHSLVAPSMNIVQENENTHVQNNVKAKQLQNQTFQFSDNSGIDHTSQTAAIECGDVKRSSNKQTVAHLAPSGFFISSNELAPSGKKRDAQPGNTLGIISDCQNSDRHKKTHPRIVVNNVSSTAEDRESDFLISKTVSLEGGFNNPQSGDDLCLRGVEERSLASNSKQLKGSSHLPSFLEKSVVFSSGENMDLTENSAVVAPDQNICTIFPGRKAAPGRIEDKSKISFKKEVMMTNSQEQPGCDMYSLVSDKKMLTVTGIKHLLSADEKTTIFSEGANMDITGNHTASADNKTILQPEILNNDISFISEDKTSVFTKNNDMEISRLDSVATDNSMEKAVSQGMLSRTNGARRKSLKGTIGEKTVLFSLSENNDMSITEGLTAAISHEIVSQNEAGAPSPSSAHPVTNVTFTCNQADIKSCSANKITVKVPCDDALISDKVFGQEFPSNRETTVFAMDDMEITKAHNASLKENFLQSKQPNQSVPLTSSIIFTSDQADMEMTEYHPVDESVERDLCEDTLKLPAEVLQEALSGSKTVIFPLDENMDVTKTHDVLSGKISVWNGRSIPAISAVPADKTIVFHHNQDDMEITSSHTVSVNNNTEGSENQKASHKSTQQPDLRSVSSSSCRDEIDSLQIKDLNGGDHKKSNIKSSIPSASSASASPTEKGPIKVHSGTIPDSIYSISIPKDALDVQALQDLGLSTKNSIPINNEQDLLHPGAMKSRRASFKMPGNDPLDCSEESGVVVSHVFLPAQHSDSLKDPPDALSTQRNQVLKDDSSRPEDLATDLAMDGAGIVPVSNKESEENVLSAEGEATEFQINSEQTKQLSVSDSLRDPIDLAPKLSGIINICSKLENIRRKSVVVSETVLSDHLLKLPTQPEDTLMLGRNSINEQRLCYAKEQENACLESGAAPIDANLGMALKDKYKGRNFPLGIFQPKLPNRRNPSVSSVQDTTAKSSGKVESAVPEVNLNTIKAPGYNNASRQNFSPSQFIAEEFLPVCPEEMDSNDSVSSEFVEEACNNGNKREILHNEEIQVEETKTCNNAKRALKCVEEDLQSLKRLKMDEIVVDGTSQDLQVTYGTVPESQAEVAESEDSPNLSAKNPDCTHANSSSSLDSVKADTELTIQRSSQMESQLLTDSICEDNLWEKFQSGVITVGEFFTLLQVHIPIQKPRQSHIPANCAVSAPPTPEDLILSQYVYRPKMRIYEEDCQVLSQMIDELKQYVSVQDQPLVNVNKSLWEVMRTCSDEELKSFGAELNKMKSHFIKESKILAHNEKEALYSKLLQSAQEQYEKLQSRTANMDELLKEAESCLADLKADSEWEECETDCSDDEMEGENSESRKLEEELGSLKAQEEELQRELSDLETENEQILAQMKHLQEDEKSCQELLERCNFTEWEISEWSELQAVFNFLHDSIELTVVFGTPIDGDVFGENPSRKIVSLSFESLLDEEKAPLSSRLVQRLIFQFIESQGCWQEKCPTLQYLPQVLHDVSLVVSRCRILGEEIEFLERWGGKYNLLKTDIIDTNVKLLFSTSTAFAKFELTLSLSSNYPSASLPFTVEKKIGNIGHEEISAVLSKVPIGYHYLRRMVSLIHQNLLQDPR